MPFMYYWASQTKLTVNKVIQWRFVLQGLPLDSHFLSYILQTVASVSSAAAPESSCCPWGRGDFLLWGFFKNICRLSDPAGWTVGMHSFSFCTFLTTWCVVLYFCHIKARGNMDRNHCFLLSALGPAPCCCNVMITGQRHQSSGRVSWEWMVRTRGALPRLHRRGMQGCPVDFVQWWKKH